MDTLLFQLGLAMVPWVFFLAARQHEKKNAPAPEWPPLREYEWRFDFTQKRHGKKRRALNACLFHLASYSNEEVVPTPAGSDAANTLGLYVVATGERVAVHRNTSGKRPIAHLGQPDDRLWRL